MPRLKTPLANIVGGSVSLRCSVVGARGGKEAALQLERRGGEHSRPCLPIPPKELNVKSNVDCIRMQPSIRWSIKENVDCSREAEPSRDKLNKVGQVATLTHDTLGLGSNDLFEHGPEHGLVPVCSFFLFVYYCEALLEQRAARCVVAPGKVRAIKTTKITPEGKSSIFLEITEAFGCFLLVL